MPGVIVNIFSIVAGVVIQCLSTLGLTVQRHFCSILEHESFRHLSKGPSLRAVEFTSRRLRNFATANPSCGGPLLVWPICARGVISRCAFCPSELQRRHRDK